MELGEAQRGTRWAVYTEHKLCCEGLKNASAVVAATEAEIN